MAARTRRIRHDDETRARIQTSQLINRLQAHVLGEVDMKTTQVAAALGLLKKTIPDVSERTNINVRNELDGMTDEQLRAFVKDELAKAEKAMAEQPIDSASVTLN